MSKTSQGLLIAIEGIDGTGKTTIIKILKNELVEKGYSVISFKEPTNETEAGKNIRKSYTDGRPSVEQELQWFIEDREWNVNNNILPNLEKGKIVILDRYYYSTACYQGARKDGDWESILAKNRALFPEPDLTIIIDVRPEISLQRIVKDRVNSNSFEGLEYLQRVRGLFLEIIETDSVGNYLKINGEQPLEKVIRKTIRKVTRFIRKNF